MISQTAEYALRAVTCLGARYAQPLTTRQVAEQSQIPPGYLSKVLQTLQRAGLVRGSRGLYGGFTLGRPPEQITILEVVRAVGPIQRILHCPLNHKSHRTKLCPLHQRLDDAMRQVEKALAATRIAELIEPQPSLRTRGRKTCRVMQSSTAHHQC